MKLNRAINPAAVFLLLGTGAQLFGQHEEQGKPEKPAGKAEPQQRQPQQRAQPQEQRPQPSRQPARQQAEKPEVKAPQREQPVQQHAQQAKPVAQPLQRPAEVQHTQQPKAQSTQLRQQATGHQLSQQPKPSPLKANYAPPQRTRQQAQTWQQQSSWRQDGAWQGHASWQDNRSANWQSDHRTWAQRGGYGGYYIPQAAFGLHFGVGNWFRIQSEPVIVGGYPRFQYGGYSFMMVDPWPGNWASNWYAADDVYVGYDNGYYLYNRQYPGDGIAITVVL